MRETICRKKIVPGNGVDTSQFFTCLPVPVSGGGGTDRFRPLREETGRITIHPLENGQQVMEAGFKFAKREKDAVSAGEYVTECLPEPNFSRNELINNLKAKR